MGPAALSVGAIELSHELAAELVRRSRERAPREACGLLLGRVRDARLVIERVLEAENVARELERFELHPLELMRAEEFADANAFELVGAWHSHPARPPVPSRADRDGAVPGWANLIVSLEHAGVPQLRCWRFVGDRTEELTLQRR